jgi:hypothetical protein
MGHFETPPQYLTNTYAVRTKLLARRTLPVSFDRPSG